MRKLIIGLAVAVALVLSGATPAAASTTGHGGWVPWPTPPFDVAAGTVCDFAIHGEALVDEVVTKVVATYPDGSKKRELAKGALILRITNAGTGASTVVDASGSAVFTYAPDGTFTWYVVGPILIGMRAGLSNLPRGLYRVDGVYRVVFSPNGFRELTMIHGTVHDVCGDLD